MSERRNVNDGLYVQFHRSLGQTQSATKSVMEPAVCVPFVEKKSSVLVKTVTNEWPM